jgi:hypothetical protein
VILLAAGQPEPETPPGVTPPPAAAPPNVDDKAYNDRVRSSFAAAESFEGPLDGGWTLATARMGALYGFQVVDHEGKLEAAWRDLKRSGQPDSSGFVDEISRTGATLTLRFKPTADREVTATLDLKPDGRWTGRVAINGEAAPAVLSRTAPAP